MANEINLQLCLHFKKINRLRGEEEKVKQSCRLATQNKSKFSVFLFFFTVCNQRIWHTYSQRGSRMNAQR